MVEMHLLEEQPVTMKLLSETVLLDAEYDRFWDSFQQKGNRQNYMYAFSGSGWTAETLNPKYKIDTTDTGKNWNATYMFYLCGYQSYQGKLDFRTIADKFDFSGADRVNAIFYSANIDNITVDFSNAINATEAFSGGYTSLITTLTLKVSEKLTTVTGMFSYASALTNLTFTDDSVIACNGLNLGACNKLTHDSLMSVINALQSGATAKTLTLGATNLAKLTDGEKAIATQKGWTLA